MYIKYIRANINNIIKNNLTGHRKDEDKVEDMWKKFDKVKTLPAWHGKPDFQFCAPDICMQALINLVQMMIIIAR